jgi:dynein intermediate chain
MPELTSRDGATSPSPFPGPVDFVDHSVELYELPKKTVKPAVVTYSKAIQTSSMSTSTSDIEPDPDDEGDRKRAGGSGRETEDEMRQRILKELEDERRALEQELKELKAKSEVQALPGRLPDPRFRAMRSSRQTCLPSRSRLSSPPQTSRRSWSPAARSSSAHSATLMIIRETTRLALRELC